ncbi:RECEPTOR-LIKE KINASE [Salix purpurea]|uniref:RECEPTOR-LIKE KINASE n=1 Tax=Salix purpurea TaxID=77065 RepID=A0A9Q0Q4C1_SALPP|nr:RECEPTOR-LIKE KINASE [Salix purpurea]
MSLLARELHDGGLVAVKKLSLDKSHQGESEFLSEAWELYERSSVMDLVDPKLREHGIVEKDVLQVIHVAFLCLQPPMSRIVAQLTCKVETVGTPMRPVFLQRRRKKDNNLSWDFPYLRLFLLCGPSPLRLRGPQN